VVETSVDGHLWGHLLDIFVDTWPLHGGISVREKMAKGKPVVTVRSEDMPNLSAERGALLTCDRPESLDDIISRLLDDAGHYESRCQEAKALSARAPDLQAFGDGLERAFHKALQCAGGADSAPAG
jgi:hypothetical protein